jgi:hypothetical protein
VATIAGVIFGGIIGLIFGVILSVLIAIADPNYAPNGLISTIGMVAGAIFCGIIANRLVK